jgi:hypothetical protein
MFQSLKRWCPSARLWVLCMSDECYETLVRLALEEVTLIRLEDFERDDDKLLAAKASRNRLEYYFTCTPSLPLFVLKQNPEIELITYLDSDLFFFSNPEPIFDEIRKHSIGIIAHRFQEQWMEINGKFNVGWLSFRRDGSGLACLNWWREQCLEWCYDLHQADQFADQKYLDQFPVLFDNLKVIEHKGANLAAWNLGNYHLHMRDGIVWVDDQPVLFYHFQGLRKIAPGVVDPCVQWYRLRVSWLMERRLFRPYIRKLRVERRHLQPILRRINLVSGLSRGKNVAAPTTLRSRLAALAAAYRGVLARRFLLART